MGWSLRVRAHVRVGARWILPAAGAAAGVLLSTQAAHAAVTGVAFHDTGISPVTSTSPLSWDITDDGSATPMSCLLRHDGTPVGAPVDCSAGTYPVSAQPPGSYTLTVFDADAVTAAGDLVNTPHITSNPAVHVVPPAPQPTAPATPSNDRSPTFGLGLPVDATAATCTVTAPDASFVVQDVPCTDPYTVALGNGAAEGDYTLAVTATADGESSDPAQVTYTLDTVNPTAPTVTAPATNPDNDTTPTFGITGVEALATVTCTATDPNGDPLAPADITSCTPSGAGLTLTGPGHPDGDYTLTVVAHDQAGNASSPASPTASATFTLDTTGPTTPTVSPGSATGSSRSPSFTVTEPDGGVTYTCTVTGPAPATASVCGPTTTLNLTGKPDGTYTLTVIVSDALGNTSSETATYTLDTAPPTTPGVTGPTSGSHNSHSPSFSVDEPDGDATVSCTVTGPSVVSVSTCNATTATLNLTGGLDGTYHLHVTATDPYGNAVTTTVDYTLDATDPPVPSVTPPGSPTRDTTPTATISDGDGTAVLTCVLTGPGGASVFSGVCPSDGVFDTGSVGDGTYTLVVTATDPAGNTSTKTVSWVQDTAAPPVPSVTPPGSPTRDTTPTVTISDGDGTAVLTCVLTGPGGASVFSGVCPSDGVFDTGSVGDGTYTLVVTATDPAGNTSTKTVSWVQDTAAPPVPSVTPPGSPTRQTQPTVTITDGEAGVSLTCVLTDPDGNVIASGACPGNGKFDTTGSADGVYTLDVTATDAAGNSSTRTVTWTRDTLAPPAPDVSAPAALTRNASVTLTIDDTEPGVALTCLLTGPSGETVFSGTCPANGTFSTNGHIDGLYTLVVTATDAAGNTATTTVSWTRDSTPPPLPSVTPPGSPTRNTQPVVTISDAEGSATLTCTLTGPLGESVFAGACPSDGQFDTTSYGDGTYSLLVTATDAAGNTSSRTVTWVRDTAPPPAPSVSAPPALTNSKTVTLTISDAEGGVSLTCLLTGPAGELVFTGACPANGVFNTNGHVDGTFTLVVTATDAAGNTSTTTVSWVRDITPPPSPSVSAPPALTRNVALTLTVTDTEAGVALTCVLTGPGGSSVFSGACPGNGVFDTTGYADGTYTLVVTATDAAGNTSTTTVSWVRDTTPPPSPSVAQPADPNNDVQPTIAISDGEAGVTLSCVLTGPGGVVFSGACPAGGQFNTAGHGDGTYTLVVTATDAAGNTSTTTVSWVRDTVDPPAPDVSTPPSLTRFPNVTLTIADTEPGVVLTCVLTDSDGTVVFSGACPSDGVFHTGAGVDGTYTLVVTATDAAGNTASTTVGWDRDTTPPPNPNVSTPAALTNSRTVTLAISDSEGTATVTCELTGPGGASVWSGACPGDGVFDTTGYGDGTYTLVVTATDLAGNTSTTTVSWVRDTVAPVTPVVDAPASPAQGRAPSFTVTEPESPVTWTCTVSGPSVVTVTQCGLTVVVDLGGAADGVYTVSVTATDPAGNESLVGTATYTLDTTPPPAPDVSAPAALTKSRSITVTITDAQPDAVLTCVVTSPGGATVFSGLCPADGTFDTTGFADGIYTLTVTATDSAGNASTTTVTWRRDTQPPPVPVVGAPSSPGNTRAPAFPVTEPESPVTYTCTVTGPSSVTVTTCGPTVTLDLTGAADGIYTVFVTATDPAGNESAAGSVSWELDTTPPPAPAVVAPTSPGNDRTPSFGVSDAEGGVQWNCVVTGPGAVTVTTCGPTTTLDMSGAADGIYTLTVTAIDAAGNVSAVSTATYRLDTTPPPAPSVTAPQSPSHDVTPTYAISDGEGGVVLTCVLTGPLGRTVYSGLCPAGGTFDTTGFADGTYTLTVTATDAAGNASTTTVLWTKDTVPPPVPSISAPPSPAQGRSVSFSVTDSESGVIYTCTISGPSSASVTSCGATTTVNLGGADGTYTVTVTATDAADNTSTSSSASYTLDTTAPSAPSVTATPSPSQGTHATFTISGVEPNGVLTCTISGPAGSSVALSGPCGLSVGIDLTGQPDGSYSLSVTVTDASGNVSGAGSAAYTLDTTAPLAPTIGSPQDLSNDRTPSFGLSAESGANLTCTVARYFQTVWTGSCGPGGSVDLSAYEDGEFEITVTATDAAGNVSVATTVVYVLDTTPPAAAVLTPPASPSPIVKPIWVFTAEDDTIVTCTITGPGGQVVQGPVLCSSPFTGLFKGLPDGTYTLTVVVTDAAGNDSAPATSVFIFDRHAPVPPTVLPPTSPDNSHHPMWIITVPKGATLTCTLLRGGTVIDGPSDCPADGIFSLAGMPDGTYTLRVTATDSAGNISATSVTTYVLDTVQPAKPELDYSSNASAGAHPYWGFTLPAGTVGRCQLLRDGIVLASKNNCKGAVSFDLTGRPAGTYTVRVYAVDAAGNVSHPLVASYVLGSRSSGQPGGSPSGSPGSGGVPFGGGGGGLGSHDHHHGPALGPRQVEQVLQHFTNATATARNAVKKAAHAVDHVASAIIPVINDKVTQHVSKAVQGVVNAVSHAGGGTGFPLLLLFVVLAFLLMQNRIDRRDPKLALASVAADDTVEFLPPPSRPARRAKGKDVDR